MQPKALRRKSADKKHLYEVPAGSASYREHHADIRPHSQATMCGTRPRSASGTGGLHVQAPSRPSGWLRISAPWPSADGRVGFRGRSVRLLVLKRSDRVRQATNSGRTCSGQTFPRGRRSPASTLDHVSDAECAGRLRWATELGHRNHGSRADRLAWPKVHFVNPQNPGACLERADRGSRGHHDAFPAGRARSPPGDDGTPEDHLPHSGPHHRRGAGGDGVRRAGPRPSQDLHSDLG